MFELHDVDNNGVLDENEIRAFFAQQDSDPMTPAEIEEAMGLFQFKDGYVDFEAFVDGLMDSESESGEEQYQALGRRVFVVTNRGKPVPLSMVPLLLRGLGVQATDMQLAALAQSLDDDSSGSIDLVEFEAFLKRCAPPSTCRAMRLANCDFPVGSLSLSKSSSWPLPFLSVCAASLWTRCGRNGVRQ